MPPSARRSSSSRSKETVRVTSEATVEPPMVASMPPRNPTWSAALVS
ncbi:hypothetical protein [Sorangium sp. So ce233]